jgi:hypothetical protein
MNRLPPGRGFVLRGTTDPSRVLREFDHVARAVDGVRRTTRRPRKGKTPSDDLLAISSALVSTRGPWRLAGLDYSSDVRTRYAGTTWVVRAHIGLSVSREREHCGFSSFLFVWTEGRPPKGAGGKWGWLRDTRREFTRAGYKLMQSSQDPEDVHFQRFVRTLRLGTVLREIERIEHRIALL